MNKIKIDMVTFLMNMFEIQCQKSDDISLFKRNVNEMVRRNQISMEVRDIIFDIYGIKNTDIYRAATQNDKLVKLQFIMNDIALNNLVYEIKDEQLAYKSFIDDLFKRNEITKTVKDLLYRIYDFDSLHNSRLVGKVNITTPPTKKVAPASSKMSMPKVQKEAEVLRDIEMFKPEFLDDIYYVYDNPSYTGCCGEQRYLKTCITAAIKKPVGSVLKMWGVIHDDGCHASYGFLEIPDEYYKSKTTKDSSYAKTPKTTKDSSYVKIPKTVTHSSGVCDSYSGRGVRSC